MKQRIQYEEVSYFFSGINPSSNSFVNCKVTPHPAHFLDADFEGAVKYGREVIASVLEAADRLPRPLCLNVNVPRCAASEIQGIRLCRQTRGFWREDFFEREDPSGRKYFWLTGAFQNIEPNSEDTDEWALAHRYVAVVPVQTDMTDYRVLKSLDGVL